MENKKKLILMKGEKYIVPYVKKWGMGEKRDRRPSFDDARLNLKRNVSNTIKEIDNMSEKYILDEVIVNVRMDSDYSAKTYHPTSFIKAISAKDIGSKKWIGEKNVSKKVKGNFIEKEEKTIGKEIFLKLKKEDLIDLEKKLENGLSFNKTAKDNIRSIDSFFLDNHSNILEKIDNTWEEGNIELVLHPFDKSLEVLERLEELIKEFGGNVSTLKYKTYDTGITFISVKLSSETLRKILKYNPIRTAHPISFKMLPTMRMQQGPSMQLKLPKDVKKSKIKVGIFDGGIEQQNPFLEPFAVENNPISTEKEKKSIEHGTGVASAILYGNLNRYYDGENLSSPVVNVESYRVLPISNAYDVDLYEVIDIIEETVLKRHDIQVYNLSIGPYGAIDDDNITRFTYAIDELSKNGDKLFVVAVGNDGDMSCDELSRIQAPADAVNCLGVGSCSEVKQGVIGRATYSSYGDGREGCKVKPDILDFGGDSRNPFQIISHDGKNINYTGGTSFSAPLVTSKAAEIIGRLELANPLLARTLLIHTANHPERNADKFMGYGITQKSVDAILECRDDEVTTVYQSRLKTGSSIKLPVPFLNDLNHEGNVVIEWTIAMSTEVDPKNTEDYTLTSIEDTFYPHTLKYKFKKGGRSKTVNMEEDSVLISELYKDGWELSGNPNSYSPSSNDYKTEEERKNNFKWDTVIKRRARMKYASLNSPYFVLHAMERHNPNNDFITYAVAVTIKYEGTKTKVYDLTLNTYNQLEISRLKAKNEVLVKNKI
ncbi:MAG: S8 family peptidase [Clostridia bacterium]|jgi:RNase H-fold protein (predicted Holliday junction resolvase)|nr:S8 family peptidase [Clostridia bacterium]